MIDNWRCVVIQYRVPLFGYLDMMGYAQRDAFNVCPRQSATNHTFVSISVTVDHMLHEEQYSREKYLHD